MSDFVRHDSIVRKIWGDADTVLLVFAGAAAEFALNRAVDWLFFTGKLPTDPIGRLFATAGYAQHIVFADELTAVGTLERIRAVHTAVERRRGESTPDWAHRDVLYMLIEYSEQAYTLLHRPLDSAECEELYDVFRRVGVGLGIPALPTSYAAWKIDRERHLRADLARSAGTDALLAAYREHLGAWRHRVLELVQGMLVPSHVRTLLRSRSTTWLRPVLRLYGFGAQVGLRGIVHGILIPGEHRAGVRGLNQESRKEQLPASDGRSTPVEGGHRQLSAAGSLRLPADG